MTDAEVEAMGRRYRALRTEAAILRRGLDRALRAAERGDVDPAFGRELEPAIARLEAFAHD